MTTREATAAVLRYSRERAGLSQADLAKKLGCKRSWISRLENDTGPTVGTLMRWAEAVDTPAWKIIREIERQSHTTVGGRSVITCSRIAAPA